MKKKGCKQEDLQSDDVQLPRWPSLKVLPSLSSTFLELSFIIDSLPALFWSPPFPEENSESWISLINVSNLFFFFAACEMIEKSRSDTYFLSVKYLLCAIIELFSRKLEQNCPSHAVFKVFNVIRVPYWQYCRKKMSSKLFWFHPNLSEESLNTASSRWTKHFFLHLKIVI